MRVLAGGQQCVVSTYDVASGQTTEVFRSSDILLEAPNWVTADDLILNGNGVLWRLPLGRGGTIEPIVIDDVPPLNNDHVPTVDGTTMFVSAYDWHIYRAPLWGGSATKVTSDDDARPMSNFLHGVSPDGNELAFVGVEPNDNGPWGPANIFTMPSAGGPIRQLTFGDKPADGAEYGPDGEWIYFNTETFSTAAGHAQCARMRPDGSELTQLTFDECVNWFPHVSADGSTFVYLSYEPGTTGHPADRNVELRVVGDNDWRAAETMAALHGGQGTINVNSWSPDGSAFAFVSYPRR